jgi:uncharacterized protein
MESRILQLVAALRTSGVRVSLAESAEAFSAVDLMGIHDREHFRLSLRTTLIKNVNDLPTFDKLFPLFFGSDLPPMMGGNALEELTSDEARLMAEALRQFNDELRQRMQRMLSGEPLSQDELDLLAQMAGLDQARDVNAQNWMTRRMLRLMEFPEVQQAMQELFDLLAEMGMNPERLEQLRGMLGQNMQGMQEQIHACACKRIAENLSEQPQVDPLDNLINRPFEALSEAEKKQVQHEVQRLAATLRTRIALRQKRAKNGQLDPRATLRANLKYQGVTMEIRHRNRVRKPRIVVLCDVSTSMRFCSELMLSFLYSLQGQVHKTHAFAFINHLEYISGDLTNTNGDAAVKSVMERMPGGYFNTNLGWSLKDFMEDYLDTLNTQTTLIVVGDGRNNYNDPRLDLFTQMARRASRTIWLNPEAPALWSGDSDMPRYAPVCTNVLKVGNLRELAGAVDQLLAP